MSAAASYRVEQGVRLAAFLAIFIAGAVAVSVAVDDYRSARASVEWPLVEGVVLSVDERRIRYAYFSDGETHRSAKRRHFAAMTFNESRPDAPEYRVGDAIEIYVSPKNSASSVLEPGGSPVAFAVFAAIGGLLAFVGGGGFARNLTAPIPDDEPLDEGEAVSPADAFDDGFVDETHFHESSFDQNFRTSPTRAFD